MLVTSAFAATDSVGPQQSLTAQAPSVGALAPGKLAGVQKAQGTDNTIWWVLGAGLVIGGFVIAATGGSNTVAPPTTTLTQ